MNNKIAIWKILCWLYVLKQKNQQKKNRKENQIQRRKTNSKMTFKHLK